MWKKDYSLNPVTYVPENSEYLKHIIDDLVIKCDEIINVTDSASVNLTNNIPTNVMSTV